MKIFATYKILFTNISKINVQLFQKMTYTLNSIQSMTPYKRNNLKRALPELKSKNNIIVTTIKFVTFFEENMLANNTTNSLIMMKIKTETFGGTYKNNRVKLNFDKKSGFELAICNSNFAKRLGSFWIRFCIFPKNCESLKSDTS